MKAKTQITSSIDYERNGKQQGYLQVPYSHNDGAWSNILIPITVLKNGAGPTLLAIGGNHGDEYEGPVALMKLARSLRPEDVKGRLIIIPALNLPALRAGTRLSPIDGENLNRAFPGKYNDNVTGMIAHYVTNILFPLADVVMDIHSGGRTLLFAPCVTLHRVSDDNQFQQMLSAARAWGTDYIFLYTDIAGEGLLPSEAEALGKKVVTVEMGGAGQCNPNFLEITEKGIRNILIHFGHIEGVIERKDNEPTLVSSAHREDYHLSPADGVYEPFFEVGESVEKGQALGQIHFPERHDRLPEEVIAQSSGILLCRRFPAGVSQGDCVAAIARPVAL